MREKPPRREGESVNIFAAKIRFALRAPWGSRVVRWVLGGVQGKDVGRKRECKKSAQFAAAEFLRAKHIRGEERSRNSALISMPIKRFLRCCRLKFYNSGLESSSHGNPSLLLLLLLPLPGLVSQSQPDDDELLSLARRPGSGEKALPSAMQQDGRFLEVSGASTGGRNAITSGPAIMAAKNPLETKTTPSSPHPQLGPFPSSSPSLPLPP